MFKTALTHYVKSEDLFSICSFDPENWIQNEEFGLVQIKLIDLELHPLFIILKMCIQFSKGIGRIFMKQNDIERHREKFMPWCRQSILQVYLILKLLIKLSLQPELNRIPQYFQYGNLLMKIYIQLFDQTPGASLIVCSSKKKYFTWESLSFITFTTTFKTILWKLL